MPDRSCRTCSRAVRPSLFLAAVLLAASLPASTLHEAVLSNDMFRVSEILATSDPVIVNASIGPGVTAAHLAAALNLEEIIALLIRRGADLDARTSGGFTPLHWAAGRDAVEAARLLVARGADVNARTHAGITPLHWASLRNATNVVTLLVGHGADLGRVTSRGMTPLHWAVKGKAAASSLLMADRIVSDQLARERSAGIVPGTNAPPGTGPGPRIAVPAGSNAPAPSAIALEDIRGKPLAFLLGGGETLDFAWLPVPGIWMSRFEITNAQYRRFRSGHDSRFRETFTLNAPDQPAVYVSWTDAQAFCAWLNERFLDRLPAGWFFRLPTEAEWAAAARCGTDRTYPWGAAWPPAQGNYSDASAARHLPDWQGIEGYDDGYPVSCPVTESGMNAWGLYGLGGNVWEWCADWYDAKRLYKVRRGGSWDFDVDTHLRVDFRGFDLPATRDDTIGFRPVIAPATRPPAPGNAAEAPFSAPPAPTQTTDQSRS
ncbi:MAG: SUMF1/EgtB/PvdO family nonheme iron enzyme [Lentisphaerae bacterium]|nr:SUMF1/EgtB/PvdO family nonheme iron enzyme [Lentisphaerota bacterium]